MTSEESFHNNYGALLQGYALFSVLSSLDYDTKIIRYKGEYKPTKSTLLKNPITRFIKQIGKQILRKENNLGKNNKLDKQRKIAFAQFQKDHLLFLNKKQWNYRKLKKNAPLAFAYVCGSDQIWNPAFRGDWCERGYFLEFVDDSCKRIAYAPSLGVTKLSKQVQTQIKPLLQKFNAISTREQAGADLIENTINKHVPVVLDPTLIYDRELWLDLAKPVKNLPKNYILVYHFSDKNCLKESTLTLAQKYNLDVVSIPLNSVGYEDGFKNVYASIEEFIYLIKNAKLVCTDSFHATVFSIIAQTPFLTFLRENIGNGDNMNSRIENLLRMTNLTDRIITNNNDLDSKDVFAVVFNEAHSIIDQEKEKSLSYLKSALEK